MSKGATKTVSYSQYSQYTQCPRQWFLNYGLGLRESKPSVNLTFGTAIHEALQHFLEVMYTESVKKAEEMDLNAYFKERFVKTYKQTLAINKCGPYSSPQEMQEFYEDGVAILDYFKKKRKEYFSFKNERLIGIEIPIQSPTTDTHKSILIKGSIDLVTYNEFTKKYTIYDIKTSTRGWSDKEKKDQTKINQILLYKKYFSLLKNVPEEDINVIFFIVRRKLPTYSDYPVNRIQEFKPANGKVKVKQAFESFSTFITECFDTEGKVIERDYPCKVTKLCGWCPYDKKPELCSKKVS